MEVAVAGVVVVVVVVVEVVVAAVAVAAAARHLQLLDHPRLHRPDELRHLLHQVVLAVRRAQPAQVLGERAAHHVLHLLTELPHVT